MRQRADRDEVDACVRDAFDRIEVDPSAGFEQAPAAMLLDGLSHHEGVHVVQEYDVGSGIHGLRNFVEGLALDFYLRHV